MIDLATYLLGMILWEKNHKNCDGGGGGVGVCVFQTRNAQQIDEEKICWVTCFPNYTTKIGRGICVFQNVKMFGNLSLTVASLNLP
jgi:hypothetical protein